MNFEYCDGYTYTIKKGDTLYEISRSHKVPLSLLLRSNPFVDVFNLQVGDTLCIPTRQTPPRPCEMWGNCPEKPGKPGSQRPGISGKPEPQRPGISGTPRADGGQESSDEQEENVNAYPVFPESGNAAGEVERGDAYEPAAGASGTPQGEREDTDPEMRSTQKTPAADRKVEWERYVVKPGDTVGRLLGGNLSLAQAFGDKNGWDNVYLLPGVAYSVPEEDD